MPAKEPRGTRERPLRRETYNYMTTKPVIIGLTGTNASGKGVIADYLKKKGFEYFSLSDVIRDELTKEGLSSSRENLINKGNFLRSKFGSDILAKKIKQKLSKNNAVIDSIRNTNEVSELKKLKGFHLVAVDAPINLRFSRAILRGRIENAASLEEFKKIELREKSDKQGEQQLDKCIQMADYKIMNDGTMEELHEKIEDILKDAHDDQA
jgi:dephospho-CoA kinase